MEDVEINFRFLMGDQANATQILRTLAVPTLAGAETSRPGTAHVLNALTTGCLVSISLCLSVSSINLLSLMYILIFLAPGKIK